ncbi:MAG TPA: DUF6629 family protein [Actinomycetota bacterium]|jgi:hypothetical protein
MCFSPEADLVGGIAIGAIGVDTLRHRRRRREIPIASLPMLLATHQLVETFVWWGLAARVPAEAGRVALWAYLLFAFCVLPVLVPFSVMSVEPDGRRRRLMKLFGAAGAAVAAVLLASLLQAGPSAAIGRAHIAYSVHVPAGGLVVAVYIVATCGPFLFSGYPHALAFGVLNLAAALVLAWAIPNGFASIWCGWAAVTAGAIALHFRFATAHRA